MPIPAQGKTRKVTVNSATPTDLTVDTHCDWVEVGEDPSVTNSPTTDYRIAKPDFASSSARQISRGGVYLFYGPFLPQTKIGQIQTVNSTSTFFIDEHEGRKYRQ